MILPNSETRSFTGNRLQYVGGPRDNIIEEPIGHGTYQDLFGLRVCVGLFLPLSLNDRPNHTLLVLDSPDDVARPRRLVVHDSQVVRKPDCRTKRKDIAFLKVHKCGSTTVSNILQRFGLRNNLNFVLPNKADGKQFWVLGRVDNLKSTDIIGLPPGEVYNILSVDTIFDSKAYRKLIPNNAFLLAIVREPVDRFISKDFYEHRGEELVKRYGDDPYVYAHLTNNSTEEVSAILSMSLDFGLSHLQRYKDDKIAQTLSHVDREFDFVMVMEQFDESLVLLKRKLCWETKDIVYIIRNVHFWDARAFALGPKHRQTIANIQKADVRIYEHFRRKLEKEILASGLEFSNEVHNFKIILRLVMDFCTHSYGPEVLTIPQSTWNEEFTIDREECELMELSEFPLVKMLQKRQREKLDIESNTEKITNQE
ncbi:hypothetical protein LOTGIDRAFT_169752 [Lottia gigantea]|uniref:Sulfotransferase domain-containing protein n=1 Tax=Lottia gigantea TaxID=225164 RepID=V4B3X7_LOTGI|nr:hypothetical protein LOTGIDRAFT_169752 [Lottia gigantea]ESO83109.1 hypothetical protein LOTGIDRAFT_169752 [Lottia gigantea]